MEFLMNSGLSNVVALTEEVFSASSEIFGKVAIKKVIKTSTEFEAFLSLKHENIVEAIEIIEAEEFAFVLMEFAEFGDVFEYIMINGLMSVEATLSLFSQVVKAIEYCHSIGIAHNDIKLENVLLSNGCVKLADFGFAKSSDIVAESEEFCGTLPYAAPEVIMGMEHNAMKADMWSMGVMLYVMLFGAFPFSDSDATSMVQSQISNTLSFPENTNETLKSLISSMLEPSVEKRANASSVRLALSQF
ncbi:testis-specific serine/threonine-protein kinase 3-like [Mytilus trossulus]|uniref:testis-specific serine/threonine-protein kinase 3-like n=1 Tax=Mytilus trossulus TaxID=6551 RepID=UPI003005F1D4